MAKKLTQKDLVSMAKRLNAIDITNKDRNELSFSPASCDKIACSYGTNGINGCLVKYKSRYYYIKGRNTLLFYVW